VPSLSTDRGIITETPAILHLHRADASRPRSSRRSTILRAARVQAFNSYLCSTVHVAHAHRLRGYRWADDPAAIER
jgi:glutathione S-transferase